MYETFPLYPSMLGVDGRDLIQGGERKVSEEARQQFPVQKKTSIIRGSNGEGNGNSKKKNHLCFGAATFRGVERIVLPASPQLLGRRL